VTTKVVLEDLNVLRVFLGDSDSQLGRIALFSSDGDVAISIKETGIVTRILA
jgi:hypothetical protein